MCDFFDTSSHFVGMFSTFVIFLIFKVSPVRLLSFIFYFNYLKLHKKPSSVTVWKLKLFSLNWGHSVGNTQHSSQVSKLRAAKDQRPNIFSSQQWFLTCVTLTSWVTRGKSNGSLKLLFVRNLSFKVLKTK